MAEIALGILGPAIDVVKWVGAPIKRQFSYLCCFTSNIGSLKDEAKNLDYETSVLQDRVDSDKNNGREEIYEKVETWLTNSGDITNRKNRILAEATEVGSGCSNFAKRFSLSKEAKKTAEAMKELIEKCKFESVSCSPPIAATTPVPFGKVIYVFNSRKRFEEDIMNTLNKDKNVDKIGVWGIGGVGKTIMAQKILNRALKEGLFDEVVMVNVSQLVEKLVIQKKIAEQLGLTLKEETLKPRAHQLRTRLRQKKRTLLLLDDVWEVVNLEELGIPCNEDDFEWCTIILTSRDKDVLKGMKVGNVCELGFLHENEAWDFFKEMAGTCVDDPILKPIAFEVMKECKGLLVALESVGKAHKDEKRHVVWSDSLQQLRKHNPEDIPNVIKEVYRPLKLSYDRLENENVKSLILLCCLFAEDADIPLEQLTYFAMGLRLFKDVWELEGVRGRIRRSIDVLRNRCLLLDGSDENHVRMHDVVRDVSIFIASEERRVKCSNCTWISSHVDGGTRLVPPRESFFPELKLLLINNRVEQETEINENLIGEGTKLNVLFIEYGLLKSLPDTTQSLKISLTALVLSNCKSLESITVVGQLESLEILICRSCHSIKELPEQARELKRLKLLEISYCDSLKRVAAGVISSMVALEELKIVRSFRNWEGSEIEEEGKKATKDARLREIESLKKLRCLEIEVFDIALAAQSLHLPSKLVQSRVHFGKSSCPRNLPKESYQRVMSFGLEKGIDINLEDLSKNTFLTRTECLSSWGYYQDFKLNLATAQSIKWLTLDGFANVSSIAVAFPLLEYLYLCGLRNIQEIWDAPIPSNSFTNLKHLHLVGLGGVKRMGKCVLSTQKDFFLQLETIKIWHCYEMEHLILEVKEDDITTSPKFTSIGPRISESIKFPQLAEMKIVKSVNFRSLVSRDDEEDQHYKDGDSLHLFCPPKVSFGNLKILTLEGMESRNAWCDQVPIGFFRGLVELSITKYKRIRSLFSSPIAQNLVNLRKLEIKKCPQMVKVIEDEEVSSDTTKHTTLFPSLQGIHMRYVPKLESFCERRCALELPSLKKLTIYCCGNMSSFNTAGPLITPALQTVRITGADLKCGVDANGRLSQQLEKAKLGKFPHDSSFSHFRNLSTLDVSNCSSLGNLFASATTTTKDCLPQLERITVHFCDEMEHVIVLPQNEEGTGSDIMIFPKLRSLHLTYLHKLVSICRGAQSIGFPMLAEMAISCCENMRCLVSSGDSDNSSEEHYCDHDSLHLFCQPKASFPNLQKLSLRSNVVSKNAWCDQVPIGFFTGLVELYISKYNKIRTLFSSSSSSKIPQNLVNLQTLYIEDCEEMLKVIGDEEEVSSSSLCDDHTIKHTPPLFPSLQNLTLSHLPELESFCKCKCALELPSLKMFWIANCREMKSFNASQGSLVVTPALQIVTIDGQDLEFADDLNAALSQHFEKAN